ncbi:phage repressor protein C with HTH and peptisase S24 domain [Roseospira visakhapatnamensis]|uniref:Phage repressor protein C with HTH and peptisase S24 domain n=2 Tax=Roseospira visakhapatnamensis TaxID=390880 RepID=A0A7W6RC19_9PROT|nr:phage repressor protein C with HTH and peptisase S24 domain [Roseospira visakhapatnamensis]
MTQAQLGAALGLEGHAAVSRYETGRRAPDVDQLVRMAGLCDVDPGWLILGQGVDTEDTAPRPRRPSGAPAPTAPGPRARKPVGPPAAPPPPLAPGYVTLADREVAAIPRYDAAVSAGDGSIIGPNAAPLGFQFVEAQWLRAITRASPDALAVIRVTGDSMEHTLVDGDWILVDRTQRRPNREGIYALQVGDVAWVKRLTLDLRDRRFQIISDNPAYPVQALAEDDLAIIGRVVWIVGRRV